MAFISAVPIELFNTEFQKNSLYRGSKQLTIISSDYVFCVGNYSDSLLKKSVLSFGDNSIIVFDTTPWACENILPTLFAYLKQTKLLCAKEIIKKIEEIKADFHCILFHENRLYSFHSLVSNRPLFYSNRKNRIVISNSLKSLRLLLNARISLSNLAEFLIPEYSNPNTTVWEHIGRIKPGSMLTHSGDIVDFQTFSFDAGIYNTPVDELIELMKTKFVNAVEKALYGTNAVLLSGGIDSSSIICTALQKTNDITGFSLVYDGKLKKCDEQLYVDAIIDEYNVDVRKLVADEMIPFSSIIDDTDEPELWPYTVRNYALLNHIKNEYSSDNGYINVIAGEGGDELLLGQIFSVFERFDNISWKNGIKEMLFYENDPGDDFKRTIESELKIIALLSDDYYATQECLEERLNFDIPNWITSQYITKYDVRETVKQYYPIYTSEKGVTSRYSQFLFSKMAAAGQVECGGWHEDEILRFGLNASYPFVDYELAEFVWSLPAQYLRCNAKEKWILREALKEYIPAIINERTDKTEATPMLDEGIKENIDILKSIDEESVLHRLGIIDCVKYRECVYAYLLGRKDLRVPLWATYTVEKWLERNAEYI